MRILVTNDDGIDAIGLHVLARAMHRLDGGHEIVVAAPDSEYSGSGASLGALHLMRPEVRIAKIDGCTGSVWAVSGPPALCVMFSRLGAFGDPFDLIVSGINPGANVGRSVYHSGTVGAALTGRNGLVSGVAVSQSVSGMAVEGQSWDEMLRDQKWESAAEVTRTVVQALIDDLPSDPVVVNINVPNLHLEEITGWKIGEVGSRPPRSIGSARLDPVPGHEGAFHVTMSWGDEVTLDPETDGGIVERGDVSITYLSRLEHEDRPDMAQAEKALGELFSH